MSTTETNNVDVSLLGATGYTGRLVCDYLGKRAAQTGQTFAVAGRRKEALEELADQHGAVTTITADCTSDEDCRALAESSRVVLNLAGPYYHRAEPLIAACARAGTHYFDLSGELVYVRELIDAHHETARASGARIAPVSGYEALPFDLMALALATGFMEKFGVSPTRIDILCDTEMPANGQRGMGQMISGGTAETMRVMLREDRSGISSDPAALNPKDDPDIDRVREAMRYELGPRSDDLEPMTMPMFPIPFLNPAVIDRTFAMLRQEGAGLRPDIKYRERMSTRSLGADWMRGPAAFMMSNSASFLGWLMNSPMEFPKQMMKSMIDWTAPKPGQGPDLDQLDNWSWSLMGRARNEKGSAVCMELEGKGHPGYRTTANMIGEAGLILADPQADLPDRAGILTPALALGVNELDRFAKAGMNFSRVEIASGQEI
jgi:short subunit dehydrogenase-like uncharacterized protein